jgi:hypothetical protein
MQDPSADVAQRSLSRNRSEHVDCLHANDYVPPESSGLNGVSDMLQLGMGSMDIAGLDSIHDSWFAQQLADLDWLNVPRQQAS